MRFPKTIKATPRTRLVELDDGRLVKVKKVSQVHRLKGDNIDGQKWGEVSRTSRGWSWHCEALGLVGLSRLEMERRIINECGNAICRMSRSFQEWHL
jgi:hypothetical protein